MDRASAVMRWSALTLLCAGLSCVQPGEGSSAADCGDGADNDANGLYDCDDPGCATSPLCTQLPLGDDDDSASAGCVPCSGTYDISSLADFTPILACESVSGSLRIDALDASVTSLPDLSCLRTIGGDLQLSTSDGLRDIDGLSNLESIGNDLRTPAILTRLLMRLFFNTQLEQVDGLLSLRSVGGTVSIDLSYALTNVDGLSNLEVIGEDLHLYDDPLIENFNGFARLTSVGSYFGIALCGSVTHMEGFAQLTEIGGDLEVDQNDSLENIDGLSGVTSVGLGVSISTNPALANIDGLSGITTIPGNLRISQDDALTSVSGLANLTSIGGEADVTRNTSLCQDHAEAVLAGVAIGGNLLINGNDGNCP